MTFSLFHKASLDAYPFIRKWDFINMQIQIKSSQRKTVSLMYSEKAKVKKMFFSSEREFKKALRDTLMRAAWFELLSTMANCGKIVTFLCLGFSIITWVIILKQLFASGSWILVNIPLDFGEWLLNIPMSDQFYLAGLYYPLLLCILTYVYYNSQSGIFNYKI